MNGPFSLSVRGWTCSGAQILGDREEQQDRLAGLVGESGGEPALFLALADGMGGHSGGALAAEIATVTALENLNVSVGPLPGRLLQACEAANHELASTKSQAPSALQEMGCTLLLVALCGAQAWHVSVGDSLLILAREGRISRLNADHSMAPLVDALVRAGELTPQQGASDPRRNLLRSALTGHPLTLVDHSEDATQLLPGDRLVLASDGLVMAPFSDLSRILASARPPEGQAAALLNAARKGEQVHLDNTTVIVCAPEDI